MSSHFVTTASTAVLRVVPAMAVYAGIRDEIAISPDAVARAVAFAIEQPAAQS